MNEEEIEELKDINRLRRRFQNTMPNFLKGGNWNLVLLTEFPWWSSAEDERERGCRLMI